MVAARRGAAESAGEFGDLEILSGRTECSRGWGEPIFIEQARWRPNSSVLPGLNESTVVNFMLISIAEGARRLKPANGFGRYSYFAWRIGFEILNRTNELSLDQKSEKQLLMKLYERAIGSKANLKRQFSSPADLSIIRSGLGATSDYVDVLPPDLGTSSDGRGRKWSVDELLSAGREAQPNTSVSLPFRDRDLDAEIAYGLMAAAELNPLQLERGDVLQLMKRALFDSELPSPPNRSEMLKWVKARLKNRWNAHMADSSEQFNAWWAGGNSNLIKTLCNQDRQPGGRLERDDVKWALLELGMSGLQLAAKCQKLFAQALERRMTPQLDREERRAFGHSYKPQGYLGGLTLPLVWERGPILRPILQRIWMDPNNRNLHAILWRILSWFEYMVSTRREADRWSKSRARREESLHGDPQALAIPCTHTDRGLELLAANGITCEGPHCSIQYEPQTVSDTIEIRARCLHHGDLRTLCLPIATARQLLSGDDDR